MAQEVGTSRQNIENLEAKGFGQPRYIAKLAEVMGTTVDDLLGREPGSTAVAAHESADEEPSPSEWAHLLEYRDASKDDRAEIDALTVKSAEKMRALRREVMERMGLPAEAKAGAGNALPLSPRTATGRAQKERKDAPFNLADKAANAKASRGAADKKAK